MIACGLDFGTSNSAIGIARDGRAVLAPVEGGRTLMPSAVFFDSETEGRVLYGNDAIAAYVAQTEGRLMRALKSILGSSLMDDDTSLGPRRIRLARVVEMFVAHLKQQAETFAGQEITRVVHGRPVRFHDDDKIDARAEAVLAGIARAAGFRDVTFVYEPIAAVHHYEQTVDREEIVLTADIGGGTSDFSIVRIGPRRRARPARGDDVLATAGVRIGGTDFDAALNRAAAMPLFGLGTRLVEKNLPMPLAPYSELSTWATINFAYTRKNERELAKLVPLACEPEKVKRLLELVRRRLGHRLALAIEDGKIGLSAEDRVAIPLDFLEAGLAAPATRRDFDGATATMTERLRETAHDCVAASGLKPDDIDTVFLTGGSSRVPAVRDAVARAVPSARLGSGTDDLLSVPLGLTQLAAAMA